MSTISQPLHRMALEHKLLWPRAPSREPSYWMVYTRLWIGLLLRQSSLSPPATNVTTTTSAQRKLAVILTPPRSAKHTGKTKRDCVASPVGACAHCQRHRCSERSKRERYALPHRVSPCCCSATGATPLPPQRLRHPRSWESPLLGARRVAGEASEDGIERAGRRRGARRGSKGDGRRGERYRIGRRGQGQQGREGCREMHVWLDGGEGGRGKMDLYTTYV